MTSWPHSLGRVLVTGGNGFIGASLVHRLLDEGLEVRIFDNQSRGRADKFKNRKGIEQVEGDIRNAALVHEAAKNCKTIIHLAYVNGTEFFYSKPDLVLDVAVRGMVNILDAAERNSVENFVLASSSEVYQTPPCIPTDEGAPLSIPDILNPRYSYGGGKILCELMALHYAQRFCPQISIFRPHNVFGPDMGREHVVPQFIRRMLQINQQQKRNEFEFEIQGDGSQTRSFIYIDDFTEGVLCLLKRARHKEIYHIGTMEERTIRSVADQIASELQFKISLKAGVEPLGATKRRLPDTQKIESIGFKPSVSFSEGIKKTVEWYRNDFFKEL